MCGLRTLSLILDFLFSPNLNYREITGLRHLDFLGESVATAIGVPNPWMLIAQTSLVLLVAFVADATITVWQRGARRQAILIGFSMLFFVSASTGQAILTMWGLVHTPLTPSLFFMGLVWGMAYALSDEVLGTAKLTRELRESEQRLDQVVDAANLGLWVWDLPRDEIWASHKVREWFGFSSAQPLDFACFTAAMHPNDREPLHAAVAAAVQHDGDFHSEYRVLSGTAPPRWISARGRIEFAPDRSPLRMRGISIDITARKLAEQELQEKRTELTHLSRAAILGELSGSLAHELNQPLTAILSNAQAARRFLARPDVDRTELTEILRDIVAADLHAGEVIRSLRLLLKKGEAQRQPLDLNEVVLDVLKLMRSELLNHHVTVETELAADLPTVHGDRVQLQQVLLNLVMNAADAMTGCEWSNRLLRVSTERSAGDSVQVTVRDHGRGIPADARERIFEPFFTTKPNGLGLGLVVCRSILLTHEGTLAAENHPDGGAVFHFTLPAARGKNQ